jgi:hypothetical protein
MEKIWTDGLEARINAPLPRVKGGGAFFVDVAQDTFPYSGGVTTMEAL